MTELLIGVALTICIMTTLQLIGLATTPEEAYGYQGLLLLLVIALSTIITYLRFLHVPPEDTGSKID